MARYAEIRQSPRSEVPSEELHPIEFPADEDPGWLVGPQIAAGEVFSLYREEIARADAIIAATPLEAPAAAGIRAGMPGAGPSWRRR